MAFDGGNDPVMDPGNLDSASDMQRPAAEPVDADDYGLGSGGHGTDSEPQEGGDPTSVPDSGTSPDAGLSPRDPYLARTAQQYGISEADFPDDASLRRAVDWATRYHSQQQQSYQQYYSQQQQQQRQLPQQLPMPQAWQNPLAALPAEEFDPRLVKAYDALAQHFNHTLAYAIQQMNGTYGQLHNQFAQFQSQAQQRAEREVWSKADSAISALGEQYEQFVGKGNVKGTARDPRFDGVRQRLIEVAAFDARRHGLEVSDMDSSDWKHFMKRAADFEFADHFKSQARAEIGQKLKSRESMIQPRQNTTVQRGSQSRDEAGRFVAEMMQRS